MNTPVLNLLRNPSHWTQETYARSKSGKEVGPNSKLAICWCLRGAVTKCYPNNESYILDKIQAALPPYLSIVTFNDTSAHWEVIDLLEKVQI